MIVECIEITGKFGNASKFIARAKNSHVDAAS